MPHVFLVWTTAGDRAHLMWHFLCDGITPIAYVYDGHLCVSVCVMLALLLSMGGVRRSWLLFMLFVLHLLIFWQVSVFLFVRIPFVLTFFFFFFFSWLQASDFSRDGNKFAILFGSSSKLLLIFRFSFSCVSYAATVFALAAGITISKKGTQRSSGNKNHSFTLLILGERVRGIERADGWRGFDRVMCFIWF